MFLLHWGVGERYGTCQHFCSWRTLNDPCPSSTNSEIINKSCFSNCYFYLISHWGCLLCCLFKGGESALQALSELSLLIFKAPTDFGAPLIFKANVMRIHLPHVSPPCLGCLAWMCAPVLSPCPCDPPSCRQSQGSQSLTESPPFLSSSMWSLLYLELWRVCSTTLQIIFWVIYTDMVVS